MELSEYKRRSGELFEHVQERLDDFEDELDFDYGQGKLTITVLDNGERYVVNTQQAALQIWMAGEATAWHFYWDAEKGRWFDHKNQVAFEHTLGTRLSRLIGREIVF